jgi:hypothetical protein
MVRLAPRLQRIEPELIGYRRDRRGMKEMWVAYWMGLVLYNEREVRDYVSGFDLILVFGQMFSSVLRCSGYWDGLGGWARGLEA